MAHVISIANNKGGVGKTTTALHLAAGLAQRGQAVLVVDADASNSSSLCWSRAKEGGEAPFQVIGMSQPVIHKELPTLLTRSSYDYVIIDCPAGGTSADSDDVNGRFRTDVNNFGALATLDFTMMPELFT
jgi:cellulose biosynthesis protein BcsQ